MNTFRSFSHIRRFLPLLILAVAVSCVKEIAITSISVTPESMEMYPGEKRFAEAKISPANATEQTIKWGSDNESVATVNGDGLITAVSIGSATISATAGGQTGYCKVNVVKGIVLVTSISLDKTSVSIQEEESITLTATVEPEDAENKTVKWSSDNRSVAYVTDGVVTGASIGTAVITATAGGLTASCTVTVTEAEYHAKERAALIAIYQSMGGDKWNKKANWCTNEDIANWEGVTVDRKHVVKLSFYDNNVTGRIPKEIGDLTQLESLYITNYQNSTHDDVGYGPMPEEIGNLKHLKSITLQGFTMSGKFPDGFYNLPELQSIVIGNVLFMDAQPLPASVRNLRSLEEVSMRNLNFIGPLPPELGEISSLRSVDFENNGFTGSVPEEWGGLLNLDKCYLDANELSGPLPSSFRLMDNYWKIWGMMVAANKLTQQDIIDSNIPAPRSPKITAIDGKTLDIEEEMAKNQYTVFFNVNPESGLAAESISKLKQIYNNSKDKGLGVITFFDNNSSGSDRTNRDRIFKNLMTNYGGDWPSFIRYQLEDYPDGTAPFYAERGRNMWPTGFENEIVIIGPSKTVAYTSLVDMSAGNDKALENTMDWLAQTFETEFTHYESSDYSEDGKVYTLQTASTGKGVDLVILGDAFSDKQVANGTFYKTAQAAMNDLFSAEPFKSLKDRFNVYIVNAVSKNDEYFNGCQTAFSCYFGSGSYVGGDMQKELTYARKAIDDTRMDNAVVLVIMNSIRDGGTCQMLEPENTGIYAGGASVVTLPYSLTSKLSSKASTLVHEVGGHGFAKLADEYSYVSNGSIGNADKTAAQDKQQRHWYMNVDFTSDLSKVLWSNFISDSRYASEELGAYPGGYTYWAGVWRPSYQSVMNNNYAYSNFNAPSRAQIWARIMKLSEGESWQYDYESFVTWDKAHPGKAPQRVPGIEQAEKVERANPVTPGKTWRQIAGR